MKANELMIGNWVNANRSECVGEGGQYAKWEEFGKVTRIYEDTAMLLFPTREDDWEEIDIKDLESIPLTPDILQRIGFKVEEGYDENYDDYEYYATMICFDARNCKVEIKYETSNKEISVFSFDRQNILQYRNVETQIQYVHELQNLFTIMQVEKEIEL